MNRTDFSGDLHLLFGVIGCFQLFALDNDQARPGQNFDPFIGQAAHAPVIFYNRLAAARAGQNGGLHQELISDGILSVHRRLLFPLFLTVYAAGTGERTVEKRRKKDGLSDRPPIRIVLVVLTLSRSFRLLFASDAGFLVMFSFPNLLLDAILRTVSLESAESAVQRFIFFHDYVCHDSHLTSLQL